MSAIVTSLLKAVSLLVNKARDWTIKTFQVGNFREIMGNEYSSMSRRCLFSEFQKSQTIRFPVDKLFFKKNN